MFPTASLSVPVNYPPPRKILNAIAIFFRIMCLVGCFTIRVLCHASWRCCGMWGPLIITVHDTRCFLPHIFNSFYRKMQGTLNSPSLCNVAKGTAFCRQLSPPPPIPLGLIGRPFGGREHTHLCVNSPVDPDSTRFSSNSSPKTFFYEWPIGNGARPHIYRRGEIPRRDLRDVNGQEVDTITSNS